MGIDYIRSDIKLTIGILVSNRIKYIRKVMEAIKPLLQEIPSELIAVDTKGAESDGSIDVVKEYTDKIYPFTWCDDFAAARNVTLKHARGEWYMFLDDDEVFDDVQELIAFFKSGDCDNYGAGYYKVKNYTAEGGERTAVVGRLVRRTENTKFVGRIHEAFNEVYEPFKQFSCFVHHYGYYFETPEDKQKHQERNVSLLRKELADKGISPRNCAQLMQELLSRRETADAAYEFFEKSIGMLEQQGAVNDGCTQWMLVASVRYFSIKKDYPGVLAQAEKICAAHELSPVASMALSGIVIENAVDHGDVSAILSYAKNYRRGYTWLKAHETEAIPQIQLDFTNFITEKYASEVFRVEEECKKAVQKQNKKKNTVPALIKSDIKLTIGMLVSNHVDMIRKCMESIKPLLDAVPSELVVLDTKGEKTDGSIEIVREYTDKIYRFTWCNDFSAARNALLDHANGEWFLYFDDDEYFDNVQEFIDFFQSGECENYYTGFYYTRDYDADGSYSMGIAGRMIRRTVNTRFEGKVHETFNEVFAPNKQFNCFTHHYGYVYSSPEARLKHQERNVSILTEMLQEEGYTPKICAQLVQEYLSVEETCQKGLEFALEALPKLQAAGEMEDSASQWVAVATVRYFSRTGEHKKLLAQAKVIREAYSLSRIATLALAATVVLSAIAAEDADAVLEYAPMYLENYEWAKANPEEALLQTQMDFPRFMEERYYNEILRVANISAEYKAKQKKAQETAAKQMKRFRKEDMQNILATLRKANRLTATPDITAEQLTGILTKCQTSAITLGEALERHGEAGAAIIHMLEEYCEVLYLQSQNYGNEAVEKEFQGGIAALLDLVEKEIEKLPADKKVVVFLPYKASMWDSLESVWKAADEDPDCEAYVVPIPYFDRNPDRSFGEMHYEGDQYPDYVPVYSWEEFSLPGMKPDMVFIHNPYDEYNYVTSIHPAFYVPELKKYAKEVIYIPYFVLAEPNPDVPMTEEGKEHMTTFCMQPGVIHSDKVIVQSEAMKKVYVDILTENFGEETRSRWEAKILGLGSPKLDKVNSTTAEDFEIPEEWKPVLYDADGCMKKVILYNTSVSSLLKHGEKMLAKMRRVFETFYEARDEIALLWRPHPLIKATIESMRPKLWKEYEMLVNEYRSASWGIYDDTADLNRALALADAYYGDPSSLVKLCQEKGMPVMVQNVEVE